MSKIFIGLGLVLALIAALYGVYQKGHRAGEDETKAATAELQSIVNREVRASERRMADLINQRDVKLAQKIDEIDVTNQTVVQPRLEREIRSEIRFSDPASGITDGMREALNSARRLSCTPAPDGAVTCPLSPAESTPGQ